MPCSELGSETSAISPPSASIFFRVCSKTARTPLSYSSWPSSAGTPKRRPERSSRSGRETPPSSPTEVESQRVAPLQDAQQQRRV